MTKFCKDCKHIYGGADVCLHQSSMHKHEDFLINGAMRYTTCEGMRTSTCGEEGKLFERKLSQWEKVKLFWFAKEKTTK